MNTRAGISRVVALSIATMLATQAVHARPGVAVGRWQAGTTQTVERLIEGSDCVSCHAIDRVVVGPAYNEIAKKYAGQPAEITDTLARRIRDGGSGNWGDASMPSHSDLTDTQLRQIVQWILSLKDMPSARTPSLGTYAYNTADVKPAVLDFPLFVEGSSQKVTKDVFRGYALFNSYCYRCHGTDATESELGPNLRRSLEIGMNRQQFLTVAMSGRVDKGMPSWAGFLTDEEMGSIYKYVKGRSLGLVPVGRPPSESD